MQGRGLDMEAGHEAGHIMAGAINLTSSSRPNSAPTSAHNEAGDHEVSRGREDT